jgi:protein-tyrosine phosphatase
MKTLLFLCTGNYYRSRYAEELFNHRAARSGLKWQAQSRGLAIERGIDNVGPLSRFALEALAERGLVAQGAHRLPQQCTAIDLTTADHIVALDQSEHRPLMRERFPDGLRVELAGDATGDLAERRPAMHQNSLTRDVGGGRSPATEAKIACCS